MVVNIAHEAMQRVNLARFSDIIASSIEAGVVHSFFTFLVSPSFVLTSTVWYTLVTCPEGPLRCMTAIFLHSSLAFSLDLRFLSSDNSLVLFSRANAWASL